MIWKQKYGEQDIKNLRGKTRKINEKRTGDIFFFVSPSDISSAPEECYLSSFLSVKDDLKEGDGEGPWVADEKIKPNSKKYSRRIKFNNCIESRYLVFDLLRAMKFSGGASSNISSSSNNEIFLDNKIIPDKEVTLKNGKKFRFVSSVIRTKGMKCAFYFI